MNNNTLRVIRIVDGTSVDGPGLRTSIYLAGCNHCCPGCHNEDSWSFKAGQDMTLDIILDYIEEQDFDVTFSGGDPMYQIDGLLPLLKELKKRGRNVWCYTVFTFEEIFNNPERRRVLDYIDVLVDGPFVQEKRDLSLRFRGSSNQRLIKSRVSTPGDIKYWAYD